jgi:hypothetical protein
VVDVPPDTRSGPGHKDPATDQDSRSHKSYPQGNPSEQSGKVHPARWSHEILEVIAPIIAGLNLPVHDPFAGTGQRLGELCDRLGLTFTGTEIEPEFIVDARVIAGDSTDPATYPTREHVAVTSPVYPNGMADHFKANDTSKRHTYRQALAENLGYDRPLHPNNMGRYAGRFRRGLASEAKHFAIAESCIPHWPTRVIVNVKDVVTTKGTIPVVEMWRELLAAHGYVAIQQIDVATPGQRNGANGQVRADTEAVLVALQWEVTP